MIHQLTVQSRKLLVYKGQGATNGNTRFFMSKTSLSNAKLKLTKNKQMLSNNLRLNFYNFKIIHILDTRYHPKIIGYIQKNKQKNKCICIPEIIRLNIMKMKMKMKNRSYRSNINRPWSRHEHKRSKYMSCYGDACMYQASQTIVEP